MSNLYPHHRQQLENNDITHRKNRWQSLMQQGHNAHAEQDFAHACRFFRSAFTVAEIIEKNSKLEPYISDAPQMQYMANHNLSASYQATGVIEKAAEILTQTHNKLLGICESKHTSRQQRMGALGVLDSSLFSLTSLLGHLSKVSELYQTIHTTEQVASRTERLLWQ